MSDLTSCNYCTLRRIRAEAKREKKKVKIVTTKYVGEMREFKSQGGVDILVDGERVAWLMELTNHCVC